MLLSELLGRLREALKILDFSRGKVPVDEIMIQLVLIGQLGYLVRLMVKGSAIKKHLKVIESFLPDRPAPQVVRHEEDENGGDSDSNSDSNSDSGSSDDEDSAEDIEHDGRNAEAHVKSQPRCLPKWQIWSEWLEILVIHFDSAQILDNHVQSYPSNKLDIKVLWQPLPDNKLLNWRELLMMLAPSPIANDLIKFLEPEFQVPRKLPTADDICRLLDDLGKISRVEENVVVFANAIDHITPQMRLLTNYSIPWSEPSITSMVNKLDSLRDTWIHTTQNDLIKEIARISKKIRVLMKTPVPTADDVGRLVDNLGKIPRVEENVVVFTNAVDHIIPQMKTLTNYTVPWSEPSIISMVDTLDSLKDTWIDITQDDLIKDISRISKKIRASTKCSVLTAEDVGVLVTDLSKIPQNEGHAVFAGAVDHIISEVTKLMTPLPWSEPLITSIVGKLDLLKGIWKYTAKDDLIKEITKIVEGIKTLTKRPTAEDLSRMVKKLGTIPQVVENVAVFVNSVDHIIFQMAVLTNCSSPWSESFIKSIVGRLNSFKHMWVYTTLEDTIQETTKIAEMIRTLRDNARLFHALEKSEPLSTGIGFKGTCHCESDVAAFLCFDPAWKFVSHLFLHPTHIVLM
jgi:hypothetical protein